ncbi:alpha/beta hydrolase [Rhodococcus globerulus]|uniref:alpha/beta hydrolase n=1 Tax=Rhodococcus globerulus TaxID=33008 RepID=UPI003015B280
MSSTSNTFVIPDDIDVRTFVRPEFADLNAVTVYPGVTSYLDRQYAGPVGYRPLTLDLHIPDHPIDLPMPVIVYAHPGGYFAGTKQMGPWRFLLDAGFAVASVSYRLSGESVFPTQVYDVAAAIRWVRAHASDYHFDSEKIVGFGSSAGSYLVSAIALAQDNNDIVGNIGPHSDTPSTLAAVIEHYGISDFLTVDVDAPSDVLELMDRHDSTLARLFGFVPSSRPEEVEKTSLCRMAHPASPPFFIVHGDNDRRVGIEQSRRLHRALKAAGSPATLIEIPGADHGTPHFDQPELHERTLEFLEDALALKISRRLVSRPVD